jgi:hypothetical protein
MGGCPAAALAICSIKAAMRCAAFLAESETTVLCKHADSSKGAGHNSLRAAGFAESSSIELWQAACGDGFTLVVRATVGSV